MTTNYFSQTYAEARCRFKKAAVTVNAIVYSYLIGSECQDELTIDVAIIGPEDKPVIVLSSGVHGVEGFLGSAIQLAFLQKLKGLKGPLNNRYVLIHAVNPYGFAFLRRANQENVDLNRNFLKVGEGFKGAPETYTRLHPFLNPATAPSSLEPFKLKAAWNILRHGLQPLKQALAGGQYEYPQGIFFGGKCSSTEAKIVHQYCETWIGKGNKIIHIDFHSGLGHFAKYKLLLNETVDSPRYSWYTSCFGEDYIEAVGDSNTSSYAVTGMFGDYLQNHFSSRDYHFVTAEFGTYNILRVFSAIRDENRAYHYGVVGSASYQSVKAELLECFCPSSPAWRKKVISSSLMLIDRAEQGIGLEM